ncbi:hypothetical protein PybrP1_007359, partial [[Pythium] brassicae (nom. inval.)]
MSTATSCAGSKSRLEGMKREEQQLSQQLRRVLRLRTSSGAGGTHDWRMNGDSGVPPTADALASVLQANARLHQQNLALRRQWEDVQRFEHALRAACVRERGGNVHASCEAVDHRALIVDSERSGGVSASDGGCWVALLEGEAPFYYVPFEEHECRSLADSNTRHVCALQSEAVADCTIGVAAAAAGDAPAPAPERAGSSRAVREPVTVRFFQWRAHLALEWDDALQRRMIRYKFCKEFRLPMRTMEQVAGRMWELLHSPALFQSIYRVPVHLRILQRWREDLSVALWSTPSPDRSVRGRAATVFSRSAFTNPQGEACAVVTLTGVRLKEPPPGSVGSGSGVASGVTRAGERVEVANQGNIYTLVKRSTAEPGAIEMEYGGRIEVLSEAMAQFLMVEIGSTLVRIENLVLPMRVLGC